jgi:hypothetical protein
MLTEWHMVHQFRTYLCHRGATSTRQFATSTGRVSDMLLGKRASTNVNIIVLHYVCFQNQP